MGITFSLVIPTVMRNTLMRTLDSLSFQRWLPGDEVLVVGDGVDVEHAPWGTADNVTVRYLKDPRGPGASWGHSVRNWVNERGLATGSHLINLDDDDVLTATAISTIREEVSKRPDVPHLFQADMRTMGLGVVWSRPWGIEDRNVTSANIVTPNDRSRLGTWNEALYNGDMEFIRETVGRHDGSVRWVPFITTISRPATV